MSDTTDSVQELANAFCDAAEDYSLEDVLLALSFTLGAILGQRSTDTEHLDEGVAMALEAVRDAALMEFKAQKP